MKRNWILILLCACLASVAFTNANRTISTGKSEITIDYGSVEGYGVTVKLFPDSRMTETTCQAIIDLNYEGSHRLFLHNAFSDPDQADTLAGGTVLKRKYQLPVGADAHHVSLDIFSQMPFFFLDVDFDGEKELVLNLARQGQRWSNAYQPIHIGYDYLYDNLKEEPFTAFDDHSEIDYDKNTITLHSYSGAGSWFDDVFSYKKQDGNSVFGPKLISHITIEYDTWDDTNPKKRVISEKKDTTEWMAAKELIN